MEIVQKIQRAIEIDDMELAHEVWLEGMAALKAGLTQKREVVLDELDHGQGQRP